MDMSQYSDDELRAIVAQGDESIKFLSAVSASSANTAQSAANLDAKTAPDERLIDTRRGAPGVVRNAVGGAPNKDRLATLQRYYPDAQPYDGDNFTFTDPETRRATLYNPRGLDFGDLPSITPELAELLGGIGGGALGVLSAAPTGMMSAPVAVPVGVGLGAAAGREAENLLAKWMTERQDTRSMPERLADTGITAGVNAAGQKASDLAIDGAKALIGPSVRRAFTGADAPAMAAAYRDLGITPMAGPVSGSRAVQSLEHWVGNTPGGAATMQQAREKSMGELKAAADGLAGRYGNIRTAQQAGELLKEGAQQAGNKFSTRINTELIPRTMTALGGGDIPVTAPATEALRKEFTDTVGRAASRAPELKSAIEATTAITDDVASGGLQFRDLMANRTRVGADLARPDVSGYRPGEGASMARVYGGISDDLRGAARGVSPEAEKALATQDRYIRLNHNVNMPVLDEVGKKTEEQAWQLVEGSTNKLGSGKLMALRRSVQPEQWDDVAATFLQRMGRPNPGAAGALGMDDVAAEFSPATFLTNWNKMAPEARRAVFGGSRYKELAPELDKLVKVTASLKDAEKAGNPSGTSRILLWSGLGPGLGLTAVGNVGAGAATIGGVVAAPWAASKLLTSPSFVKWLSSSPMTVTSNPQSLSRHLGRLVTIAEAEPEIRDAAGSYLDALRAAGAPAPTRDRGSRQ